MSSFDMNIQVEDFLICDFYNELQETLLEMARDNYKNSLQYFPNEEI